MLAKRARNFASRRLRPEKIATRNTRVNDNFHDSSDSVTSGESTRVRFMKKIET